MRYIVWGYDSSGETVRLRVEADSMDEARISSGIPASRIEGVKEDAFGATLERITKPRPKGEVQAIFMASLGAILLSGQGLQKGIDRLLSRYNSRLRYDPERVRQQSRTSELLEILNFDPVAISLVKVGEKTGTVAEALSKAASNLIYQMKLKEELGKELVMAWVYIGIGTMLMSIIIFGFGPVLKEIGAEPGLVLPKGAATNFILSAHSFAQSYWLFVVAAVSLIFWQKRTIWRKVRYLPILNWFWTVGRLQNALFFTSGFQTLFNAGITEDKAFRLLRTGASVSSQQTFDAAISTLNEGNPLSRAIDTEDWPDALREGLSGFEAAPYETKKLILTNIIDVLLLQQKIVGKRVAKLAFICGMGLAICAIILMVFGAIFPLQQIRAV